PHLSEPRSPGNYATGLWATVFRAKSGDADRAYEMASAVTARINADPREPYEGFDASSKPTGTSGYGPSSAIVGMFAWGIFGFEPSTEENQFQLQPAIPAAWSGETHSYRYEYALSSDFPASGLIITYTLHDKLLDTVFDFGGIRPGVNRIRFETGGKIVTVDGVQQGPDFLFHVTLNNGAVYHVQFLPSGLRPGPQYQTARAAAPGTGMGLPAGQHSGVVEGALDDAAAVIEVGVNWDSTDPPGSFPVVFLSNNKGKTWEQVANGEAHLFAAPGTGLRYRIFLVRSADEDVRLRSLAVTYAGSAAPAAAELPTLTPAETQASPPAFVETFDAGLESAGEHDGGKRVYRDTGGSILGAGCLAVVSDPGQGDGSVWLARGIGYDPAAYPFLDFWVQTRSANYSAIWPELADTGLVRDGLAYRTTDGRTITPLLLLTAEAPVSPDLMNLGNLNVPADGRRFHVSYDLNRAVTALFGPGPHRITGFRLVDYVDPGGSTYRFDEISARKEQSPALP
ncbi:MAG: hypothetical protein LC772_09425, partial [Chloroflexi bacterium]|nr:hypothetical protein [Chloroflexota bacterium]